MTAALGHYQDGVQGVVQLYSTMYNVQYKTVHRQVIHIHTDAMIPELLLHHHQKS